MRLAIPIGVPRGGGWLLSGLVLKKRVRHSTPADLTHSCGDFVPVLCTAGSELAVGMHDLDPPISEKKAAAGCVHCVFPKKGHSTAVQPSTATAARGMRVASAADIYM